MHIDLIHVIEKAILYTQSSRLQQMNNTRLSWDVRVGFCTLVTFFVDALHCMICQYQNSSTNIHSMQTLNK
ncbi:hypothetical protein V1478_002235 [Vespula squamosa]|uniref:Uncharacterized protein n=1 Tax=Vespula squamosa TaxID=30214 RepID=A0ABD2BW25_VESSQ